MDKRRSYAIGTLGILLNLLYWGFEAGEYGLGGLVEDFYRAPTEHVVILAQIPLFLLVGRVFYLMERRAEEVNRVNERLQREIDQRKKAEEAIKNYARKLEEVNTIKDLFTDIMRHDLLNPAGSIKVLTDLLLDGEEDPEKREVLEKIQKNSSKLIEMVETASLYSKLEDAETLARSRSDLNTILKDCLKGLETQLEKAGMEVLYSLEGEYPVQVNPIIENVFSNFITNAIKYASTGKKIEIGVRDGGDTWQVYVKDYGEGIADLDKEKLFTRFQRLGKEGVKGTGLGLTIAKRVVELHGGRIWVEDNPEGGSIFYVELPKAS
jgi:signal transduction histidine kinase